MAQRPEARYPPARRGKGHTTLGPWYREPTPLQLALARGHRWLAMLESGQVTLLREIAQKEGVDIQLREPDGQPDDFGSDIVAAILDETLPADFTLFDLAVHPPPLWEEHRRRIGMYF